MQSAMICHNLQLRKKKKLKVDLIASPTCTSTSIMSSSSASSSINQSESWGILKDKVFEKCEKILVDHPGNRACKYTIEYLKSDEGKNLSEEGKIKIIFPKMLRHQNNIKAVNSQFFLNFRRLDFLQVHQDRYRQPRLWVGLLCHDPRGLFQVWWIL